MSTPNEPDNTQNAGASGPARGAVVPPWQRGQGESGSRTQTAPVNGAGSDNSGTDKAADVNGEGPISEGPTQPYNTDITGDQPTNELRRDPSQRPAGPPPRGVVSADDVDTEVHESRDAPTTRIEPPAPVTKLDNPPSGPIQVTPPAPNTPAPKPGTPNPDAPTSGEAPKASGGPSQQNGSQQNGPQQDGPGAGPDNPVGLGKQAGPPPAQPPNGPQGRPVPPPPPAGAGPQRPGQNPTTGPQPAIRGQGPGTGPQPVIRPQGPGTGPQPVLAKPGPGGQGPHAPGPHGPGPQGPGAQRPTPPVPPAPPKRFAESPTTHIERRDLPGEELPNLDKIHHVDDDAERAALAAGHRQAPVQVGGAGGVRAAVQVRRIDPWATFKVSAVLAVVGFFIWMIAVAVLYLVLGGMGVWDQLNSSFNTLTTDGTASDSDVIGTGSVFFWSGLIGAISAVLITALATVGSYIYNICADLVGGVEITIADLD